MSTLLPLLLLSLSSFLVCNHAFVIDPSSTTSFRAKAARRLETVSTILPGQTQSKSLWSRRSTIVRLAADDEETQTEESTDTEHPAEEVQEDPELVALKQEIANLESALKAKKRELFSARDKADEFTKEGYARQVAEMENMRRARSVSIRSRIGVQLERWSLVLLFSHTYLTLISDAQLVQSIVSNCQYLGRVPSHIRQAQRVTITLFEQ